MTAYVPGACVTGQSRCGIASCSIYNKCCSSVEDPVDRITPPTAAFFDLNKNGHIVPV
jgi:hypothetical protein